MAYHLLATVLTLLATSVLGQDNLSIQDQELNVTQSNSENVTGLEPFEATLMKSNAYPMLFGSGNSTRSSSASCRQKNKCTKQGGICQAKGTCPGRSRIAQDCNQGCDCCLPDEGWCHYIDLKKCNGDLEKLCSTMCGTANSVNTEVPTYTEKPKCPAGFTNISGRCYLFSQKLGMARRTREEARLSCIVIGGDLATAGHGGASDADPLLKYIHENDLADSGLWLGATQVDGVITWFDGRDFSRDSYLWYRTEPQWNNQECVAVYAGWTDNNYNRHYISDWGCTSSYHFVCEK